MRNLINAMIAAAMAGCFAMLFWMPLVGAVVIKKESYKLTFSVQLPTQNLEPGLRWRGSQQSGAGGRIRSLVNRLLVRERLWIHSPSPALRPSAHTSSGPSQLPPSYLVGFKVAPRRVCHSGKGA